MKKFKKILKNIEEAYDIGLNPIMRGTGSHPYGYSDYPRRSVFSDFGVHRIDQGDSLVRLNAFIHKFLSGDYIDPEGAIKDLRIRLNHAGLDFNFSKKKLNPGVNVFEVKVHGNVFGKTPTTGFDNFDKGEDLPNLILTINVDFDESCGLYRMDGKLSTNENIEPEIQPDVKEDLNEDSDPAKSVMHFIMRNNNVKDKVLMPVYNHLKQKEKKGKLSIDDMRKELYFVVNTAMRKMNTGDKKIALSQKQKSSVVTDLVRNYKKYK